MTTEPSSQDDASADATWAAEPIRAAELDELLVHGAAAVIATDLEGVITHWSAGAERLYGWTGIEAIGVPFLDLLVAPGDRRTAEENIKSILSTGGWEGEFDLHPKGGGAVVAYVRCAVVKDDAGRPVGMLGLSMNVPAPPRCS